MNEDELVTVRFALKDAKQTRVPSFSSKPFAGNKVAYFASELVMWWPIGGPYPGEGDGPFPFPVDGLPEGWKIQYEHPQRNREESVVLRLTRSALAQERRTPYEILDEEPEWLS